MGLDYGSVTVGVALTDSLGHIAMPHTTITRDREDKLRKTFRALEEIIAESKVEKIVLGLPKNMDDSLGERAQKTLEFGEKLEKRTHLPVIFWDERLTTFEAGEILDETGFDKDRKKRKKVIDQIAAQLILESYIRSQEIEKDKLKDNKNHG